MRILFLSNLYPPNVVGGYEQLCFDMAAALAARGHEVAVLTSDYGGRVAQYPGQRVERRWTLPVGKAAVYAPFDGSAEEKAAIDARNVERFDEMAASFRPDVLFVWNLFFLDATLLQAIGRHALPTVFLLTDNWMIAFLNNGFLARYFADEVFGGARGWLQRLRLRLSSRGEQRFRLRGRAIFASRFMERLYREAGFSFDATTVIYHGIAQAAPTAPVARDRLRTPGEVRLLFAGRVVEIKGVHTAIAALAELVAKLPGQRVSLTIVGDRGDSSYVQRLEADVTALDLNDRVTWQAPVAEAELPAVFAAHDIYLFPSLYEPFSLTLIHALRAGIPTVASDAGGNTEIVIDGKTGKVFRRGDAQSLAAAVIALVDDAALRAAVAEGGRRIAADYTFERMVEQVEAYLGAAR